MPKTKRLYIHLRGRVPTWKGGKNVQAKKWIKQTLPLLRGNRRLPSTALTCSVTVTMYFYNPTSLGSPSPGDLDHLVTTIFGLLNKNVIKDDRQIVTLHAKRFLVQQNPEVKIWVTSV